MNRFLLIMAEARRDRELIPIIKGNPNQKELIKLSRELGVTVDRNGKGELLFSHPSQGAKPIIMSASRRKDTPWGVIDWFNKVIRSVNVERAAMLVKASDLKESDGLLLEALLRWPDEERIELPDGGWLMKYEYSYAYYDSSGKFHREGEPAVVNTRYKYIGYYEHGLLHRTDGPALVNHDSEFYYVKGKRLSKEEFDRHFGDD